jgi:CheY-like chemotaxis protein
MRLLIAEADADLRQVLRELLQQSGYRQRGEGGAPIHEVLYPPPYMRKPVEAAPS